MRLYRTIVTAAIFLCAWASAQANIVLCDKTADKMQAIATIDNIGAAPTSCTATDKTVELVVQDVDLFDDPLASVRASVTYTDNNSIVFGFYTGAFGGFSKDLLWTLKFIDREFGGNVAVTGFHSTSDKNVFDEALDPSFLTPVNCGLATPSIPSSTFQLTIASSCVFAASTNYEATLAFTSVRALQQVPEPSSLPLMAVALIGLGVLRRRVG